MKDKDYIPQGVRIHEILEFLDQNEYAYSFAGDSESFVFGFSSLTNYRPDTLTWIKNESALKDSKGGLLHCVILPKPFDGIAVSNQITVKNPKEVFFAVLDHFWGDKETHYGIGEGSYIGESVTLGRNVSVGRNCFIDGDVQIGDGTRIGNNVNIVNRVSIGSDCVIEHGTVIGIDGGGFSFDKDNIPHRVRHYGGVRIGDRVEIGCNCAVDRGTIDDTVIEDDVKITDLVQIGHNSVSGRGTIILSGAILCGSAIVGEKCYIAPGAVVRNHTEIGDNSFVGLNAVTEKPAEANSMIFRNRDNHVRVPNYRKLL